MIHAANLPDVLPVFPLPGALLLPRARLPLHIFEPRYLAMLDDTLKTAHRLIGLVQPHANPDGSQCLHRVGCAGRVTAFSETEDGRYMITLTGISRFKVKQEIQGFTAYRKCEAQWNGFERDLGAAEHDPALDREQFLTLLAKFFQAQELKTDLESLQQADDELLVNSLSMLCPFSPEDKQALLEAPCLKTRRETLVTLMEYALHDGSIGKAIQ